MNGSLSGVKRGAAISSASGRHHMRMDVDHHAVVAPSVLRGSRRPSWQRGTPKVSDIIYKLSEHARLALGGEVPVLRPVRARTPPPGHPAGTSPSPGPALPPRGSGRSPTARGRAARLPRRRAAGTSPAAASMAWARASCVGGRLRRAGRDVRAERERGVTHQTDPAAHHRRHLEVDDHLDERLGRRADQVREGRRQVPRAAAELVQVLVPDGAGRQGQVVPRAGSIGQQRLERQPSGTFRYQTQFIERPRPSVDGDLVGQHVRPLADVVREDVTELLVRPPGQLRSPGACRAIRRSPRRRAAGSGTADFGRSIGCRLLRRPGRTTRLLRRRTGRRTRSAASSETATRSLPRW